MYKPTYTNHFRKDFSKLKKRNKDLEKLYKTIEILTQGSALDIRYRDHKVVGNFSNHRECHIEPDLILIYKIEKEIIVFERTGTHSDLFK